MKFQVEHDVFTEAVSWVARTIPSRPSLPILAGIKIEAHEDGTLVLSSYDPDISSEMRIDALVDEPGQILVNGRLLADFARALPKKPIFVELDGSRLNIMCASTQIYLQSMPLEEYPELVKPEKLIGTIDGAQLQEAVGQVVSAASHDETLPLLVSICVEIEGEKMALMATDRYRLALREMTWKPSDNDFSARLLVRATRLADITKNLSAGSVDIYLEQTDRGGLISFQAGGRTSVARLIDGDYPQVRGLFPEELSGYCIVERASMLEALKRARLVVEKNSAVRLNISESGIGIEAGQGDGASTHEEIHAVLNGPEISMGFNPTFVQEGLSSLNSPYFRLSYTHPSRPAVVTAQESEEGEDSPYLRILMMPIRNLG